MLRNYTNLRWYYEPCAFLTLIADSCNIKHVRVDYFFAADPELFWKFFSIKGICFTIKAYLFKDILAFFTPRPYEHKKITMSLIIFFLLFPLSADQPECYPDQPKQAEYP